MCIFLLLLNGRKVLLLYTAPSLNGYIFSLKKFSRAGLCLGGLLSLRAEVIFKRRPSASLV